MNEQRFEHLASDTLKAVEHALGDLNESFEADLASDVLTVEFEDGRQFILNSNRAARQIWFAAHASAWHFSYDQAAEQWIDTRGGAELYAVISGAISKKLGREVKLTR